MGTTSFRSSVHLQLSRHTYSDILDSVEAITPLIRQISQHNPNLADQLDRASTSVALNCGEGMYGRGRRRVAAYGIAAQEMGESVTALEVAERCRYVEPLTPALRELSRKVLGTLVKLAFPRRS
jgi:four helix bundle protein